jgi:hypothetical protein
VEAIEQYANTKPMPASSLEWLMGLVAERRKDVDEILGFQVSETLLYTLGRVHTTPDEMIADEGVMHQNWTGD